MWFECLPSFGIIVVALGVPHAAAYILNKVSVGNMYRRRLDTLEDKMQYLRDRRLSPSGSPYFVRGIESIPDA